MTDRDLLEKIALKDALSFKTLYDRYCDTLNGWAFSRLKDSDATADLMQEFWTAIWLNPQSIQPDESGNAKRYLVKNVSFRILKYFHKLSVKLEITSEELVEEKVPSLFYTHIQEELNAKEIQQLLDEVLDKMPILAQKIYELRCIKELSTKETASALGIAESTVRNGLSSVMSSLRTEVGVRFETGNAAGLKVLLPLIMVILTGE